MFNRIFIVVLTMIVWTTLVIVWMLEPRLALALGALALLAGTWIWIDERAFERDYNDET
jgi:hypothetical protein